MTKIKYLSTIIPLLELGIILFVIIFLSILAQIINKGCHSADENSLRLITFIGGLSYYIWRVIKLEEKNN